MKNNKLKTMLLLTLAISSIGFSKIDTETKIYGGYDFSKEMNFKHLSDEKLRDGYNVGIEQIFSNDSHLGFGIGGEYNIGNKKSSSEMFKKDLLNTRLYKSGDVYATTKVNMVKGKDGDNLFYGVGRLGYTIAKESKELKDAMYDVKGGLYSGIGLGTEYKGISLEAMYERTNITIKDKVTNDKQKNYNDSFGVKLGYTIGADRTGTRKVNYVPQPLPQPKPQPVKEPEPIVEVVEPVREPVVIEQTYGVMPFSCEITDKICIIRGFKVDGRVPSNEEIQEITKIADTINKFAIGGSIDVVGHTDSTGKASYNDKLGYDRAVRVVELLKQYGLSDKITINNISSSGESNPMDTNETQQGRYNNRRVVLYFSDVDFGNVILKH